MINVVVPAAIRRQKSCFSPVFSVCFADWNKMALQSSSKIRTELFWLCKSQICGTCEKHHSWCRLSPSCKGGFSCLWQCGTRRTLQWVIGFWSLLGLSGQANCFRFYMENLWVYMLVEERANQQLIYQVTHWSLLWVPLSDRFQMQLQVQCSEFFWKRQNSVLFLGVTLWLLQTKGIETSALLCVWKTNLWALRA